MLVLTRKKGEAILIGEDIEIVVVGLEEGNVKIAINAPREVSIIRKELIKEVSEENKEASNITSDLLEKLKNK